MFLAVRLPRLRTTSGFYDWDALDAVLQELPADWRPKISPYLSSMTDPGRLPDVGFDENGLVTACAFDYYLRERAPGDYIRGVRVTTASFFAIPDGLLVMACHPEEVVTGRYLEHPQPDSESDDWTHLINVLWRWENEEIHSVGDVALTILTELTARLNWNLRKLGEEVDEAERAFYFLMAPIGQHFDLPFDPKGSKRQLHTLFELATLVGRLEPRLSGFDETILDRPAWLEASGPVDSDWTRIEARYRRALESAHRLRANLRAAMDLIAGTVAAEQLGVAQSEQAEAERRRQDEDRSRRQAEAFQRDLSVFAGLILVPTLVASVLGSNVDFPWSDEAGWWILLGGILFGGIAGFAVFQYRLKRRFTR